MSKKKEELKNTNGQNAEIPLEGLTLDFGSSLYPLPPLVAKWAKVLKRKQELQHLRTNELLEKAMADVLSGKVTAETIDKELEDARKAAEEEAQAASAKPKLKLKPQEEDESEEKETKDSSKKKTKSTEKVSS